MLRASLTVLALAAALPAAAQERGGVPLRNSLAELNQIDSNTSRGCPLSATSVTVGVNKAFGTGSSGSQQLATLGGSGPSSCRPLVSTQVVAGANLGLGRGSSANQAIIAQGPRGVLATTTFTRGANIGFGSQSTANQLLVNQTGR
ncbi:MAG TPA: hypothetical protein VGM32_17295 [Rhodopila sp.]|jgi:hypothetical protein